MIEGGPKKSGSASSLDDHANDASAGASHRTEPLEPMTLSLMGKLFGVPLLIIGSIVGGAVLVVVLFGAPSTSEQRSVDSLLQALESSSGQRSMGVLLPKEKELWQTALELAERLKKKDVELSEEELEAVTSRIASLLLTDLRHVSDMVSEGEERENQLEIRGGRLSFLIHALGQTERPEAIEPLIEVVRAGQEPFVAVAIMKLADLKHLANAKTAVEPLLSVLHERYGTETRLVTCTALSVLADRGDERVVRALESVRVSQEGELAWAAALALARIGSTAGKMVLLDLMDREFWESQNRYEIKDKDGNIRRYPMPPGRVESFLIASIEAASGLEDAELRKMIERLESDRAPAVRAAAVKASRRSSDQAPATIGPETRG